MHCERFQIGDTLNLEVAFGPFTVSPPPVLFCVHVIVQSVPLQEVHAQQDRFVQLFDANKTVRHWFAVHHGIELDPAQDVERGTAGREEAFFWAHRH